MNKNTIIDIKITDIAEDGSGIGRFENMVVFVRGMLPGEYGEVLIIKVTKSYAIGKLQKLIEASSDRITPPSCENFSKGCGGCTFCHFSYEGQLKYKENRVVDCLTRIGGFESISEITKQIIPSVDIHDYRNKSIYPFGIDSKGNIICGFYASASHRIIPIQSDGCGLENDMSRKIREFTIAYVQGNNFSIYNEEKGTGFLRALMVRTNSIFPKEAMVVLIVNGSEKDLDILKNYALALNKELPFTVSIYACFNTKNTNILLNGKLCLLYGKETISDVIGSFDGAPTFDISPLSFFQINPRQTERLYDAVYDALPKDSNKLGLIYDIYCGIGTIGLYLLSRLRKDCICDCHFSNVLSDKKMLVGVEYVASAVENAKKNAQHNGFGSVADFYQGDAGAITPVVLEKYGSPSVIILDPPRKGCDDALINTVLKANAEHVIYVSCNPATLARDLKQLCSEKYECISVQPVDMFPQCGHVESVVCLSREKADDYRKEPKMISDESSRYKSWSNLKKQMHDLLCDSLKDKISYFYTSYHEVHNAYGRATINYCKKEIAAFSWIERYAQQRDIIEQYKKMDNDSLVFGDCMLAYEFANTTATKEKWMPNCTLCETDFINSLTIYLKTDIAASLNSDNYLLRVFAYMDRRVGKRTLIKIKDEVEKLPEWVKQFYQIRCEADGIVFPPKQITDETVCLLTRKG